MIYPPILGRYQTFADYCRLLQTIADFSREGHLRKTLIINRLSFLKIFESANSDNFFYGRVFHGHFHFMHTEVF